MGKETKAKRHNTILQSLKRHKKIRKLRVKLLSAEPRAKEAILLKLKKIHAAPLVEVKPK
jgi:hypothetical protein